MNRDFSKQIKQILQENKELHSILIKWNSLPLDSDEHIMYDPSQKGSKGHFDAIMQDVNVEQKELEAFLNKIFARNMLAKDVRRILRDQMDIIFASENVSAGDIGVSDRNNTDNAKKVKESRERELSKNKLGKDGKEL